MAGASVAKRIALKNILYLTDFSEPSEAALPFVADLARGYGATVHALHVLLPPMFGYGKPELANAAMEAWEERARKDMDRVASQLVGIRYECAIERAAEIWPVVEAFVREREVDLIVLGTHGRTGAQRVLLGSVAEEIFRLAKVPVLTIGPEIRSEPHSGAKFRKILFATDFSAASVSAVGYAFSLAEENNARIYTLHVIPERSQAAESVAGRASAAEAMHRLHGLSSEEDAAWCKPHAIVRYGSAAREIIEVARELSTDLIVIGVRNGDRFLGAMTHVKRATAHNVVAHARCPVLTVAQKSASVAGA